jgi:hypothetical protein
MLFFFLRYTTSSESVGQRMLSELWFSANV